MDAGSLAHVLDVCPWGYSAAWFLCALHSLHAVGVAWGIRLVVKPFQCAAEGQPWQQLLTERLLPQPESSGRVSPESSKSTSSALQKHEVLALLWSLGCRQTGALLERFRR